MNNLKKKRIFIRPPASKNNKRIWLAKSWSWGLKLFSRTFSWRKWFPRLDKQMRKQNEVRHVTSTSGEPSRCSIYKQTKNRNKTGSNLSLGTHLTVLSKRLGRKRCCDATPDRCLKLCGPTIFVSHLTIKRRPWYCGPLLHSQRWWVHGIWYFVTTLQLVCFQLSLHYHLHQLRHFWQKQQMTIFAVSCCPTSSLRFFCVIKVQ